LSRALPDQAAQRRLLHVLRKRLDSGRSVADLDRIVPAFADLNGSGADEEELLTRMNLLLDVDDPRSPTVAEALWVAGPTPT
jgi:hypothetical protein